MSSDLQVHAAGLRQLERPLPLARVVAIGAVLLTAVLALGGFRGNAGDVVRAERVELVDREGRPRALLGVDSLGFAVTLLDERGRPAGSLRLSDEPWLAVQTDRGREVAGLGAPKVHNLTE